MEEEAMPFPREESTPPVMKMYFDVFGTGHLRNDRKSEGVVVLRLRNSPDGLKSTDVVPIGQRGA